MTATDAALRTLDAGGPTSPAERARLDARIERMLAAEPVPVLAAPAPARPGRRPRRVLALVGAAAAIAVGFVLVPGPGDRHAAWATWTPTPSAAAASEVAAVVEECRARVDRHGPATFDAAAATVVLSERRGDVLAVILRDPARDLSAQCLADAPAGTGAADLLEWGVAGSEGPPALAPARGFLEGSMAQFGGDEPVSLTDGAVGQDVVGLTIHAGGRRVEATVQDGRYTAWWPGRIFADEDAGPSGAGGPRPDFTVDVTLRDGTVIRDAPPSRPIWR
ncbi:hypothetical protein [Georgenia thermotolerans]|uniref:Uncharacterized protein n=1 Tax=Georgenia thermotolerans TaxID=527326 RepID=A0A7J5UT38_9MICO|nr:hypothetical protein [Georgenia thermotolerans]KAE8765490.1 hypothetical protein GB883_03620 [Georgenia thermotolerans]